MIISIHLNEDKLNDGLVLNLISTTNIYEMREIQPHKTRNKIVVKQTQQIETGNVITELLLSIESKDKFCLESRR